MTELLIFGAGLVVGVIIEWKYGKQASALNAQAHADIATIKAAVTSGAPPAA